MSVAIVTPIETVALLHRTIEYFPSFHPRWYTYSSYEEAVELAMEAVERGQEEAMLVVEHCIYNALLDTKKLSIPVHHATTTGNNIYRALFLLFSRGRVKHLSCEELPLINLCDVLADIDYSVSSIHYHQHALSEQQLINEHIKIFETNAGTGCITTRIGVANELKRRGYPCVWMEPTRQDIMVSLERLLLVTNTRRRIENQHVFGLIKGFLKDDNEKNRRLMKSQVHTFTKQLNSYCQQLDSQTFLFMTTRGTFEHVTRGYKSIPFFNRDVSLENQVDYVMGVGFGSTTEQAYSHVEIAFNQSNGKERNQCYIVNEDKQVVGPVAMTEHLVYETSITDSQLIEKGKKAGMTATYISRLIAQVKRNGKAVYTAQELADILGITLRSTHRNLLRWQDAEIVKIVGEEKTSIKGRPRTLYSFQWFEKSFFS